MGSQTNDSEFPLCISFIWIWFSCTRKAIFQMYSKIVRPFSLRSFRYSIFHYGHEAILLLEYRMLLY